MFVGGGSAWCTACDGGTLHASFLPKAVYFFLLTFLYTSSPRRQALGETSPTVLTAAVISTARCVPG